MRRSLSLVMALLQFGAVTKARSAAGSPPNRRPGTARWSGRGGLRAVLVEDPVLDALRRVAAGLDGPQEVEEAALAAHTEGTRGEGDEDFALLAPPEREA